MLNVIITFVNKPLYLFLPNPTKHFVYKYHFAKEIAEELKKRKINNIYLEDKELLLRLRFYNISEGEEYGKICDKIKVIWGKLNIVHVEIA